MLKIYGFIPARFASSRFPGKPLAEICGKPMIWHVFKQAKKCTKLEEVFLATDDEKIFVKSKSLGIPVVMTSVSHESGTDRILEATQFCDIEDDAIIVNIQGDEPILNPEMITQLVEPFFEDDAVQITTLAHYIDEKAAEDINKVKVILRSDKTAIYFSRAKIPFVRQGEAKFLGHIGLYAFRLTALKKFVSLGKSNLENLECLEQLRLVEAGIPIHVVITKHISIGVDIPEDIQIVEKIINGC